MNDCYNNLESWEEYKKLCQEFRENLLEYISKGKRRFHGIKARNKSFEIQEKGNALKSSIKMQRQDYRSDYS